MAFAIARKLVEGSDELTIRMDPAELGRVQVRLAFDEGGTLRAVVAADSAAVLDTIRRDSGELMRLLGDTGVRTDAQSFRFDRGSHGGAGDFGQNGGGQPRWHSHDDRGDHNRPAEEPVHFRPLRRNGRLDLMA